MIIVRLQGGLGNQMFQYAMGRSLAHRHNTVLKFDLDLLLDRTPNGGRFPFREFDLEFFFGITPDTATTEEIRGFTRRANNDMIEKVARKVLGEKKNVLNEPHYHYSQAALEASDD